MKLLTRTAQVHGRVKRWVVPRTVRIGDRVVVYVGGHGFFATARIDSTPAPRADWKRRYGAALADITLINPPISLTIIRRSIPALTWARYPRSVTTPPDRVARAISKLIADRENMRFPDIDDAEVDGLNVDELRALAKKYSRQKLPLSRQTKRVRVASRVIHRYVLLRSKGQCEGCRGPSPFNKPNGEAYLEPHHTRRLADGGPDDPCSVIALCPNCHRRAHHSYDQVKFNNALKRQLRQLESRQSRSGAPGK